KPDHVLKGLPDAYDQDNSRLIACQFQDIHVICVYCPNGQDVGTDKYEYKLEWFRNLRRFLDTTYSPSDKVCLLGDFNIAPDDRDVHDPKKWEGQIHCSERERNALKHILDFGF